jgi:hypothetical protein
VPNVVTFNGRTCRIMQVYGFDKYTHGMHMLM